MTIEFQRLRQSKKVRFGWLICSLLSLLFLVTSTVTITPQSFAADLTTAPNASTLFELNCAGCHANGGNIIRRGKNLKKRAMARNGYESVDAIADIITNGKGIMSSYSDRLNAEEISAIAQYVHQKSEAGW